jgi:hypothetical protein
MKKLVILFFLVSFLLVGSGFCWQRVHSIDGKCEILFPQKPEHYNQMLATDNLSAFLKVDIYMAALDDDLSIFSLIVTHFPNPVDPSKEVDSLESFLNGVLNSSESKTLKEASFSEFDNLNALNFLIEDQKRFLKGRVILNKDKLYLLSIEFNEDEIDAIKASYEKYISSFKINE